MKATQKLHELGQALWLDNITRTMVADGTLKRYIDDYSITGLTSNPTIFDQAIGKSDAYDDAIAEKARAGKSGEDLFFELAIEDLSAAADLFRSQFDSSKGISGWVSLEVSPALADDAAGTIKAAATLHKTAKRPNLFMKIPGTTAGAMAIEETIFAGVPVNVTLLFSKEQYLASAEAYMRGLERRQQEGLDLDIASVASVFVSRWDVAIKDDVPADLQNKLGVAIGQQCYAAYRALLASERWQKLSEAGAKPQRLLLASTGVKDENARDTLYVEALAAPDTIDTMPEKTLLALFDHGRIDGPMPEDGLGAEGTLDAFARAGIDTDALAVRLQEEGKKSFEKSWKELLKRVAEKAKGLAETKQA